MGILTNGFEVHEQFLPADLLEQAIRELEKASETSGARGIRNAEVKFKFVNAICRSTAVQNLLKQHLSGKAELVRAIVFDKTPDANWLVPWHQDRTVALNEKREMEGWGPWTLKDRIHHVQPPLQVLESMLTFRIHLDPAHLGNGCLKIAVGSHHLGIIEQNAIASVVESSEINVCEVGGGGLVLMKPHVLHASSKSTIGGHRRVLHLEYSNYRLESGLNWAGSL